MTRPGFAIRRHRARRTPAAALVAAGAVLCLAAGTGVGLATDTRLTGDSARPADPAGTWQPGCAAGCATSAGTPRATPTPPTRVRVARIGVDSPLTALDLDRAGTLVPPADFTRAGWYGGGPAPGDPGPAVIAGHLDSRRGPAVFARLGELRPGDRIEVWRGGRRVPFRVTGALRTPKDAFPTATVYGPTPGPELRLITCGGDFDRRVGHYRDNVVVFAVADAPADPLPRSAAD
ncbi:class F sortase [Micromonospora antibiotica]|uniref:class F sortase n=1 Tax=Micromonospora antibiotica TaxID=2807623 RepID=UPI0027DB40F6|nr:class F sortase [Micromonospora antibiotica]